jgi:hypothetical protein
VVIQGGKRARPFTDYLLIFPPDPTGANQGGRAVTSLTLKINMGLS